MLMLDRYLRDLPNTIAPSKVADAIKNHISPAPPSKKPSKNPLEFEWISDPYELAENAKKLTEKERTEKFICDLPFFSSNAAHKEKYESMLGDEDSRIKYYNDPFDAAKEKEVRESWLDRMQFLHGEFKPSTKEKNLEKVGRSLLPDIVLQIRKCLTHDWPDAKLIVGC